MITLQLSNVRAVDICKEYMTVYARQFNGPNGLIDDLDDLAYFNFLLVNGLIKNLEFSVESLLIV